MTSIVTHLNLSHSEIIHSLKYDDEIELALVFSGLPRLDDLPVRARAPELAAHEESSIEDGEDTLVGRAEIRMSLTLMAMLLST